MTAATEELVNSYVRWLRDRTAIRDVEGWVEITTPYLDRHNDYLQIYVRRQGDQIVLTDDGYILRDLEQSGCALDTSKRAGLLRATLRGFGVQERDGALEVTASESDFPAKKHDLLQAMLAVNDLFYLAQPTVASLFKEDVAAWLEEREIRFTPEVRFAGRSGYDHLFHFVIPKSASQPERILQAITHPTADAAKSLAFAWIDTRETRPLESKAYALLNDVSDSVSESVVSALRNYEVTPVPWTRREEVSDELAA